MSYIIKETSPFIGVKLTEIGRQKLAMGQLTFNQWAAGDSEIDYGYVSPNLPGVNEMILRPKDEQPNLKYYLRKIDGSIKTNLSSANLRVLGITVNNKADERGFFNIAGDPTTGWPIQTGSTYIKTTGTLPCNLFNGGNTINLGTTNFSDCDFVLFIVTNPVNGTLSPQSFSYVPVPYLWFKIVSGGTSGSIVTLDRDLPDLSFFGTCNSSTQIQYIIYPGCNDPINTFYGSGCTSAYWNTGTLSFDSCCEISVSDVLVWNQNNVWCEDIIGTQSGTETHRDYGSIDYIGEKQYLGFPCECPAADSEVNCCDPAESIRDGFQKGIGIIHYTNNTISNFYGEFFYVDGPSGKVLTLDVPTVMWYNRDFGGVSGTGDIIGMRFVSDTTLKYVTGTDIQYYDLIEDATYSSTPTAPLVVGRVYPQLKIVVITDEELLAAMSYKSNRNWTLPELKATLTNPSSGTGLLSPGETLYLTYDIRPTSGLQPSLPCQYYVKITNTTVTSKDVYFHINGLGKLPYMREVEQLGYDGLGFYGHQFVLLSQIVTTSGGCRPDSSMWRQTIWTDPSGGTLSPTEIEDQNPVVNDFLLTVARYSGATYYDNTILGVPLIGQTNIMNFGDERFFYGNLDTYIGAKIFKTIFSLSVDRSQFVSTTNPSYTTSNNGILNLSEIGIYDNLSNLVMIGKFSTPVILPPGSIADIEMTLDF
jgi:hypothetical protein